MRCIATLLCLLPLWQSVAAPDFTRPHTHLGAADFEGRIVMWTEFPSAILSDGTALPLRLRFSAIPPGTATPQFGKFWWCPLMESTLVQITDWTYQFSTLGGQTVYLSAKKDGSLLSPDGHYTGHKASPTETLIDEDGWHYRYVGGRLQDAKTPSGSEVDWTYVKGRLMSITEKGKGPILQMEYGSAGALATAMMVNKMRYDLKSQQVPIVSVVTGVPLIAGFDTSLADIRGGYWASFPIKFDRDGTYSMIRSSSLKRDERTYTWDAASGLVKSDGKWTYKVEPLKSTDPMVQFVAPMVSRKDAQGNVESYYYDVKTGTSEYRQPDGLVTSRLYFTGLGPTNGLIRKMSMTKKGKEIFSTQWSYDEAGRMIRERGLGYEKDWTWQPNGQMAAYTSTNKDGIVLQKDTYNEEGKVIERQTSNGLDFKYTYDHGKMVMERFENGKLQLTQVLDPNAKQNVIFTTDAMNGGLVPSQGLGASLPSKDVDAARSVALRVLQATNYGQKN